LRWFPPESLSRLVFFFFFYNAPSQASPLLLDSELLVLASDWNNHLNLARSTLHPGSSFPPFVILSSVGVYRPPLEFSLLIVTLLHDFFLFNFFPTNLPPWTPAARLIFHLFCLFSSPHHPTLCTARTFTVSLVLTFSPFFLRPFLFVFPSPFSE